MGMRQEWNSRNDGTNWPHAIPTAGELRQDYLRGEHGATVFDFDPDIASRHDWDESDLRLVTDVVACTRTEHGLYPDMDDDRLADSLGHHGIFGVSRLSHSERFARATFHFHELCARIFGEYPHYHDPDAGPLEWREALAAYVFFLRIVDASWRLDRRAEAVAERNAGRVIATLAREAGQTTPPPSSDRRFAHAAE